MPDDLIDKDLGWDALLAKIKQDDGDAFAKIGVQKDTDREPSEGEKEPIDMVKLAAIHEFGAKKAGKDRNITIPERSFIRGWHDSARPKTRRLQDRLLRQYIDGKITMRQAIQKLGAFGQGGMRKFLRDLDDPVLAQSTELGRRKGTRGEMKGIHSSNPLVDTGQLLASIHYITEIKGAELDSGETP